MNIHDMKLPGWMINFRKPAELDEDLQRLEAELSEKLIQIKPEPQFVIALRHNLLKQLPNVEFTPSPHQHQALQTGLLVAGGILGSAFLLLTGVRGFISLIGIVGLLISWFKQNSRDTLVQSDLAH